VGAILVTGGAGYIGSHTVKALRRAGHEVVVVDDLSAGHREAVAGDAAFVHGDLCDVDLMTRTMRRYSVSGVVHFAALASVSDSVRDPVGYYASNVTGTLSLLDAMVRGDVRRLVFSSTCAIYGEPESTPIDEAHPKAPINAYGETKLAIERAFPHYARAYGLSSIALRYFNAAGADPDGELGEDHAPEVHLIPNVIAAANGGPPLSVHGTDYPTPDGTCLRDFIHVSDLASAHLLALETMRDAEAVTTAYNLGTGRPHSVLDVIATAERVLGRPVPYVAGPRRPGDPAVLYAAPARAKTELGWTPRYPELSVIVETACRWHLTHPRGYANGAPVP
jgi:UDP-glucose-4-epimerase GalE